MIIKGFTCQLQDICTGVSQRFSISPILFNMYLSNIFEKIEQENSDITTLSFTDDIDFLTLEKTVEDIQKALTEAEDLAVK